MGEISGWESFYVIIGSAAGALIGLQFIVMTLIAEKRPTPEAGAAFATPTIVHFSTVLLLSAVLCAPWRLVTTAAALWGLVGLTGVPYTILVAYRMRTQNSYKPEFEDWLFHFLLPLVSYSILAGSASVVLSHLHEALFGVGSAAVLLLFIGIHNTWDSVAYNVFVKKPGSTTGRHHRSPR